MSGKEKEIASTIPELVTVAITREEMQDIMKDKEFMKLPPEYDGDPEKFEKFDTNIQFYIHYQPKKFTSDEKKIGFVTSLLTKGRADEWKQTFQKKQLGEDGTITLPSFKEFMKSLRESFEIQGGQAYARDKVMNLHQVKGTAQELVTRFESLAASAGMNVDENQGNQALISYFRKALNPGLLRELLRMEHPPKTMSDWTSKAIVLDNAYRSAQRAPQSHGKRVPLRYMNLVSQIT